MSAILTQLGQAPTSLQWWAWPKLAGLVAAPLLLLALLLGASVPPLVVGLTLHLVLDFTLQSSWVAAEKSSGGKALAYHAAIAGGIPALVAGLAIGPATALFAGAVGIMSHWLIDRTNKFGLSGWQQGIAADQAAHVAALLLVL